MATSAVNSTKSLDAPKPSASQPRQSTMSLDAFLALPDELKVEILRYILPSQIFGVNNSTRKLHHLRHPEYPQLVEKDVIPLLLTIPDTKDIIYDVIFASDTVYKDTIQNAIWYPRPSVAAFVRRVVVNLDSNDQSLAFLSRFASGELGFSNMVDVVVNLNGNSIHMQTAQLRMGKVEMRDAFAKKREAIEPIIFDAKKVPVAYEHAPNHVWEEDTRMPLLKLRDTWAQLLLEKMKLKGGEKEV
jgi:hypothetical protein